MDRGRRASRVEFTVAANRNAGRQRLELDTPFPPPLERLGLGPHSAVRACTNKQVPRQLVGLAGGECSPGI
jgi:hypothetical protein